MSGRIANGSIFLRGLSELPLKMLKTSPTTGRRQEKKELKALLNLRETLLIL